jgi:hypothetical protein
VKWEAIEIMAATAARQGHQFHRYKNHKKFHPGPASLKGRNHTTTPATHPNPSISSDSCDF